MPGGTIAPVFMVPNIPASNSDLIPLLCPILACVFVARVVAGDSGLNRKEKTMANKSIETIRAVLVQFDEGLITEKETLGACVNAGAEGYDSADDGGCVGQDCVKQTCLCKR